MKPPGACKCRSLDAIWSVPVYPGGGRVRRVWRVAMSAFAGGFVLSPWLLRAQPAPVPLSPQMAERSAVRQTDPQAYRIDVWRVDEGLPQSSVTSIVQTRDGYLWLGTFNGLVR